MAEQTRNKIVLDDQVVMLFEGNLKRIFAMKITRSTFRELQNIILTCANQNKEIANFLFETLMTGQIKGEIANEKHVEILEEVIKDFTIPARLSQEVHERGEFVSIITSDLVSQGEQFAYLNRVRRVDGEEFVFLSDTQNTVHLTTHFISRLYELQKNSKAKWELDKHKKELSILAEKLKQISL